MIVRMEVNLLNKRIKKLRNELNLTQQEFANKIGITQNTYANYEIGRRNPSNSVINNICKTFNVNEDWLRYGQGQIFLESPNDTLKKLKKEYNLDDFSYGLICEYLKLDDKKRNTVRQYFYNVLSNVQKEESDIDEMVEDYRKQLELEKKAEEKSEASQKSG